MSKATSAWIGFSRSFDLVGNLTAFVTWREGRLCDVPSHTFIGFDLDDGSSIYYEALMGAGWTGPWDRNDVVRWQARFRGRKVWFTQLRRSPEQVAAMHGKAEDMRGHVGYSAKQLWQLWALQRLGRRVPRDDDAIVCSDGVSVVCAAGDLFLPDLAGRRGHDEMTPHDVQIASTPR